MTQYQTCGDLNSPTCTLFLFTRDGKQITKLSPSALAIDKTIEECERLHATHFNCVSKENPDYQKNCKACGKDCDCRIVVYGYAIGKNLDKEVPDEFVLPPLEKDKKNYEVAEIRGFENKHKGYKLLKIGASCLKLEDGNLIERKI